MSHSRRVTPPSSKSLCAEAATDITIAARSIAGQAAGVDRPELDIRFEAARPRLFRTAAALVGLDAAEDVVHDTYLAARSRIDQLRDPAALEAWLVQICVRRCFRVTKRSRQLVRLIAGMARPASEPAAPWLEMRELLESLPPRERTVLVLHHGYGHTLIEVAELLGISHANARAIASRGRRALLRRWLESER